MNAPSDYEKRIVAMVDSFTKTVARNFSRNLKRAKANAEKHYSDEPVDYRQPPQQTGRGGVLPQKAPGEAVRPRCREGLPEILRQTRASRGGGSHAGQAPAARRGRSSSGRGQAEQRSDEFRGVALSGRAYQDPAPRSAREVVQMNISSKGAALLMEMG